MHLVLFRKAILGRDNIAGFTKRYCKDEDWVDEKTICDYLNISTRTLQRLRKKEILNFSMTTGKPKYTIGEVRRMLREGLVRSNPDNLQRLIDKPEEKAKAPTIDGERLYDNQDMCL